MYTPIVLSANHMTPEIAEINERVRQLLNRALSASHRCSRTALLI